MQTWERVRVATRCGNCRKVYTVGDPMLSIEIAGVKTKKLRGPCCAGEAPPDLAPMASRQSFTKPIKKLKTIAASALPRDFKVLQGGLES